MNKITEKSRKNIIHYIKSKEICWSGKLKEYDFLSRIFYLKLIPSNDNRFKTFYSDFYQHRVNFNDWEDYWIFEDERFDLLNCNDSKFLDFLCEMIHPIVRENSDEVNDLLEAFNKYLKVDNFEIVKDNNNQGFTWKTKDNFDYFFSKRNHEIKEKISSEYIYQQINNIESSIEESPYLAIGTAKELIETCCKTILSERGENYDNSLNLKQLLKKTNELLKLTPNDIPNEKKASETIKSILGSLANIVDGISELRNTYGSGHGKDKKFKGLNSRHAKLVAGASITLAIFLLETNEIIS